MSGTLNSPGHRRRLGWYNTTKVTGETLKRYQAQAEAQEDLALLHFMLHPDDELTPEDIRRVVMPKCPLTSARRAVTNLAIEGFIEKLTRQVKGMYGKPVHVWRMRWMPPAQRKLL